MISTQAWGRADDGDGSALDVPLRTTLLRNYAHELGIFELQSAMFFPVWKSTPGLEGPRETSELSSSAKIDVDSAEFWTNRLLSSSSRSTFEEIASKMSHTLTLKSG